MGLKNQKGDKVLELLFEYPNKKFTVREISKRTKIPSSSVQRYLKYLKKEDFVTKENKIIVAPYLKFKKSFFVFDQIFKTGLIDYLDNMFNPSLVIVFGSMRKGEYDYESDLDIFIESTKNPQIDLLEFEKRVGHKIQLFLKKDIRDLPPKLFNNVINGVKLRGYFKIK